MLNKRTVDDLKDIKGKKVLVRCDFNVPIKTVLRQNLRGISIREKIVMLPTSLKDKLLPTGIPYRIEEIKILY